MISSSRGIKRRLSLLKQPATAHSTVKTIGRRQSFIKQFPPLIAPKNCKVSIEIISNHGDKDVVSCSEIAFFTKNKTRINVKSIQTLPEKDPPEILQPLISGSMIKTGDEKIWEHKWPIQHEKHLFLHFVLETSINELDSIRIWAPEQQMKGMKDIVVYKESSVVWQGEVKDTFATIISIPQPTESLTPTMIRHSSTVALSPLCFGQNQPKVTEKLVLADEFGAFPSTQVNDLTIRLVDSHGRVDIIALHAIFLYDIEGKYVNIEMTKIEAKFCSFNSSPALLFEEMTNKRKVKDKYEAWVCTRVGIDDPMISLHFECPASIAAIRLVNPLSFSDLADVSVRNVSVSVNGNNIFHGRLQPGKVSNENESRDLFIYLVDPRTIKDLLNKKSCK